jgi:hypothetical protein
MHGAPDGAAAAATGRHRRIGMALSRVRAVRVGLLGAWAAGKARTQASGTSRVVSLLAFSSPFALGGGGGVVVARQPLPSPVSFAFGLGARRPAVRKGNKDDAADDDDSFETRTTPSNVGVLHTSAALFSGVRASESSSDSSITHRPQISFVRAVAHPQRLQLRWETEREITLCSFFFQVGNLRVVLSLSHVISHFYFAEV